MPAAQLHANIRYIPLTDDDGDFGLMLHHDGEHVYNVVEVQDRDQFTRVYNEMLSLVEAA